MARSRSAPPKPAPQPPSSPSLGELLVPLGTLLAVALPFFVFSLASNDALREAKLLVQALGAAVALAGLAIGRERMSFRGSARLPAILFGFSLLLALVSGLANASRIDPLTAGAVLPPLALVLCGFSDPGAAVEKRAFTILMACGAFSGSLAATQRFAGLFRLPLEAPEPRFFAAALIGNPGDVAAALVAPGLLLWMKLADSRAAPRTRALAGVGLGGVLFGIGATEAITPLAALGAGALAHLLFDPRGRWKPFAAAAVLLAAALAGTGAGRRALVKLAQVRRGDFAAAATQRDIGFLAAVEMARVRPLTGVGPGSFSNTFVPARIAAEERAGRRFWHSSGSAHFENAHSEPVTLAAECGLPAAALAVAAAVATLVALARRREDTLFALLLALGVLSLASFPLRLAVSCGPAAFLLGSALRRTGERDPFFEEKKTPGRWMRRWMLPAATLLVVSLALLRAAATWSLAEGENRLRAAALMTGPERPDLILESRTLLRRSLSLRPRAATAWLALGSTYRLEQDFPNAREAYSHSLSLEERAETDFNLGVCLLRTGREAEARPFFVRAVWILFRLADSLPPDADAAAIRDEVARATGGLKAGGKAPRLPASFQRPL